MNKTGSQASSSIFQRNGIYLWQGMACVYVKTQQLHATAKAEKQIELFTSHFAGSEELNILCLKL